MIGSRLRSFRLSRRLTLDDLAGASRISRGTIHRIELDQVSPRLDTLVDLCHALGTDLPEFFQGVKGARGREAATALPQPGGKAGPGPGCGPDLRQILGLSGADAAYLLDPEGAILGESDSAQAFHGGAPARRLGAPLWAFAHPEDQASVQSTFEWLVGAKQPRLKCYFRAAHRDGAWRLVQAVLGRHAEGDAAPVFTAELRDWSDGAPGTGGDAEALLDGLSRTFGNQVMRIQRALDGDCRSPRALESVRASVRRMDLLLKQVRLYTGRYRPLVEALDLNGLVQEAARSEPVRAVDRGRLRLELDPALPGLAGDRILVRQLAVELIVNALEAHGEGPEPVQVRTLAMGFRRDTGQGGSWIVEGPAEGVPCVSLVVRDQGPGLTPDALAGAFRPFVSKKSSDHGMGLPGVLGILRAHEGALWVQSEPDWGSTFRAFLPLGAEAAGPEPGAGGAEPAKAILLVDDEVDLRQSLAGILDLIGYSRVEEAATGEEALRLFRDHPNRIGLVLLDVNMPGMGGIQAGRALRSADADLPIVLMTGSMGFQPPLEKDGEGMADEILFKPFGVNELRSVLTKHYRGERPDLGPDSRSREAAPALQPPDPVVAPGDGMAETPEESRNP